MGSAQLDFLLSQLRKHLPPCGVQAPGEPGTSSVLLKQRRKGRRQWHHLTLRGWMLCLALYMFYFP